LGDVQAVAERDSLAVSSLKPTTSFQPVPLASPAASTSSNPFDAAQTDDFDVSVRGSYRDIVSFLRDLSHMPTLTRVVSAQLDRSSTGDALDGTPLLDATIHIQTLRLDPTTLQ
jgi:hypothetical protein